MKKVVQIKIKDDLKLLERLQRSPLQKHINCGSRLPSKKIFAHLSRLSVGERVMHILSVAFKLSSLPSIVLAHQPDGQLVTDSPLF